MRIERVACSWVGLSLIVAIGGGCGGDTPAGTAPVGASGAPSSTLPTSPSTTAGSLAIPSGAAGGGSLPTAPVITPPVSTVPSQQATPGVPCDVAAVISENCTTCHSNPAKFSAPMPLMAHADFMVAAKSNPMKKVFQVIPERINATDIKLRMPPASGSAIAAPGLKALNDWLNAGAVAVTPSCAIAVKAGGTPPATGAAGSAAPPPGTGELTPTGGPRAGGATNMPQKYDDPLLKCYEFRAHANGDKTMPYSVSTQPDMYTNFTFTAPWQGMMYARSFRVLTGNAQVIHHWLFYKNSAPSTDGAISPSIGAHPDGELVHGWAPGGSDLYLDQDVGLELPASVGYTLETHHNNTTGSAKPDNSGIEICVTPTAPKNVASLSWLGTDAISGTTASGVCAPTSTEPIHIIGVQPHMHLKGKHMQAIITRNGGKTEMMHDAPFDFQYQHSYDANFILMPGDSIKTTCTFTSPASFGEGTNDEMCYLFTLYYPKLSLTNGNPVATLIHGPNTCLQ